MQQQSSHSIAATVLAAIVTVFSLLSPLILHAENATITPAKAEVRGTDNVWQNALDEINRSFQGLLTKHRSEMERLASAHTFTRGNFAVKEIALTFDDGPHPEFTPRLLEVLRQCDVKATFFLVGKMAEKHPQLVKDQVAAGHQIANHTYNHVNLNKVSAQHVAAEVKACEKVLQSITGETTHLFRPPGGNHTAMVTGIVAGMGYTTVLWTDNPGDYSKPSEEEITRRLLERVRGGSVILLHDGIEQTLESLPAVITTLKQMGYRFVTVDQMIHNNQKQVQEKKPAKTVAAKP